MINFIPVNPTIYMKQKNSLKLYKPKLTQDEIQNMNTPLTIQQIEFLKNLLTEKTQAPNNFTAELYQTFKAEIITILQKLFQKTEVKKIFSNSFYEDNITLITQYM